MILVFCLFIRNIIAGSAANIRAFYNHYGANIAEKLDIDAEHCQVRFPVTWEACDARNLLCLTMWN